MPEDSTSNRHRRSAAVRSEPERQSELPADDAPKSQNNNEENKVSNSKMCNNCKTWQRDMAKVNHKRGKKANANNV